MDADKIKFMRNLSDYFVLRRYEQGWIMQSIQTEETTFIDRETLILIGYKILQGAPITSDPIIMPDDGMIEAATEEEIEDGLEYLSADDEDVFQADESEIRDKNIVINKPTGATDTSTTSNSAASADESKNWRNQNHTSWIPTKKKLFVSKSY